MPQPTSVTRLTLMPTAPRQRGDGQAKIRRYRLATVRPAAPESAGRYAQLKRSYD